MKTKKVFKRVFLTVMGLIASLLIICLGFWLIDGRTPQAFLVSHALPQTTMDDYEKGKNDITDKMKAAGVDVRLHVKKKMGHVYPLWPCPEGKAARKEIAEIIGNACVLTAPAESIYNFTVKNEAGNDVSISEFKGKVMLIVNTATKCGFTPQYAELEKLYEKYHEAGLEILDFPCNQFGNQAPGSVKEIREFCTANYGTQFVQFDKIEVNGENEAPLYTYLKAQKGFGGFDLKDRTGKLLDDMLKKQDADYAQKPSIKWNFTKFLVSRDGKVLKRYEPTDKMSNIDRDIMNAL